MVKRFILNNINRYASKWLVLIIDLLLVALSFGLSYFIRFDASFSFDKTIFLYQLPVILTFALFSFLVVGSYKGIIRHTGTRDAFNVLGATVIMAVSLTLIVVIGRFVVPASIYNVPISILIIHYFVSTFLLIVARFLFKSLYDILKNQVSEQVNVLIYGAGDSGMITYGVISRDAAVNYRVVGFVDDDTSKVGKKIDQIKIIHSSDLNTDFLENNMIEEVIISIQNIDSNRLLKLTDSLIKFDLQVKIIPSAEKWIAGGLQMSHIRQVRIEDLLDRAPINIKNPIVEKEVIGKTILITGAAGSIGSEIVKQLSNYGVEKIVIVDSAESPLYDLQQELIQNHFEKFIAIVASIRDAAHMSEIFGTYRPDVVFHAAAYKHVPLMEENHYEAIRTNVLGTKIISDLALKHDIDRFVMISTDKAVNPTNIMGATKRIAELYITCLSKASKTTKFTTTRFGNVLGSNGSVIPLFKRQIENGGPLTVTHKEITRFFMTIPEACSLVLEAGTMGNGGEIYIFDMGQPVKIFDIAKRMIQLSGYEYPSDIDIKITGLRPGEKLYEELLADGENTLGTYHQKIMIAKVKAMECNGMKAKIEELCINNTVHSGDRSVCLMKEIVPEFKSKNSKFEKFDKKLMVK